MTSYHETRSRFDKDVAWSAFAMFVPILFGIIALPILYRNAHQQAFTLFLLFYGAVSFAPGLDFGISRTAQRRLAFASTLHADARIALVNHSLRRGAFVSTLAAIVSAIGAILLFPHSDDTVVRIALAIETGFGVGLAIYANCQRGVLEGLGAFARSALNRAGVGIMLVGAPVATSFFTRDPSILSFAALAVRAPFLWQQNAAIRKASNFIQSQSEKRHDDMRIGFMRESGWFAVQAMLAVAMSGFDRYILIGWARLHGQSLDVFLATQDWALRAIGIPSALLPVLAVRLAVSESFETASALSRRLFFVIVPCAVAGCMIGAAFSPLIIRLLYPRLPNAYTAMTLDVLLPGIAISAIAQFPTARLQAGGRARDTAIMHIAEFALYLALAPIVIYRFGAPGAAAMWSGRIILDALLLIGWSQIVHRDRSATWRESAALLIGTISIVAIGTLL